MSSRSWIPDDATPDEERLLREHVVRGSDIDSIPEIPDAPDIALRALEPNELPVIGLHFVTWGSKLLNDIRERPVRKTSPWTEDEYVRTAREHVDALVAGGVKDPDPQVPDKYSRHRADRAEQYARWRYRGYVAGEVHLL